MSKSIRVAACGLGLLGVIFAVHWSAPAVNAQQGPSPNTMMPQGNFQSRPQSGSAGGSAGNGLGVGLSANANRSRQHAQVFTSPEEAFRHGVGSWRGGYVERAIPALRYAAEHNHFLAQYYLARILADNSTPFTDHVGAYQLFKRIALDHSNIDPDDDQRAPFVARALASLAGYVRSGLPAAGVKSDPVRSVEYLRHAAQFFNDEEAQFDLAKIYLQGDAVPADPRMGLHYLSVLTQRGHAGAQAFLADIYWRGRYGIKRDEQRAFALATVAAENAPETERVWIEDMYHNIYCGMGTNTRQQSAAMVADWRQRYGRGAAPPSRYALGELPGQAQRTCRNGELVPPPPPLRTGLPGGAGSGGKGVRDEMLDIGVKRN